MGNTGFTSSQPIFNRDNILKGIGTCLDPLTRHSPSLPLPSRPVYSILIMNLTFITGGFQDWFTLSIAVVVIPFLLYRLFRDPNSKSTEYYGNLAWIRAFLFYSFCIIISWGLGVFDAVIVNGTSNLGEYTSDTTWIALTTALMSFSFVGYWIIWPMGTVSYGRKKHSVLFWQVLFGIVNGLCEGMLNVSIWAVAELFHQPRWATFLIYFCIQGGWKANWDTGYWNVYVTPAHNVMSWNLFKVATVHSPMILFLW
jgi:hypothetical protein